MNVLKTPKSTSKVSKTLSQRGQVIIEYVLLLVVALGLAAVIMRTVVSRDKDEPGFLMAKWQALINQVAADDPNKRGP